MPDFGLPSVTPNISGGSYRNCAPSSDRGRDLALGAAKLAAKYGVPDKAAHVKGMEMPAYDPRGSYGMGLAYATSERGACHLRAFTIFADDPFKLEAMARDVIEQNGNAVKWSMCFCDFWGSVDTAIMADLLTAGLGRQVSAKISTAPANVSGTWCVCSIWVRVLRPPTTSCRKKLPNRHLKTDPTTAGF